MKHSHTNRPQTEDAEQAKWEGRLRGLLDTTTRIFFQNNVMYEVACEPSSNCNIDQQSFKAYLTRWMAATTKVVPWTHDIIMPLIQQSAQACAKTCSGNSPVDQSGTACGTKWTQDTWDNTFGVGQQMNALEVFQSNLIDAVAGPLGNDTGGTSKGDPSAGSGGDRSLAPQAAITTSDRAGAGILTALVLVGLVGGAWWMVA